MINKNTKIKLLNDNILIKVNTNSLNTNKIGKLEVVSSHLNTNKDILAEVVGVSDKSNNSGISVGMKVVLKYYVIDQTGKKMYSDDDNDYYIIRYCDILAIVD